MSGEGAIRLPDADVRRRAATDFDTNLVVLAGAGTGKTSLLIERALNAIGSGVAAMDSIAAITFTEKAAGEMRERLAVGLDRLRALARDGGTLDETEEADRAYRHLSGALNVAPETIARRALEAMEQLDHGTVVTIHRFCAELLRAWPVEAGVDPGFVVDSGEWMASLGRREWEAFVERELGPEGRPDKKWGPLLARISIVDLGNAARDLAGFGVPRELLEADGDDVGRMMLAGEARRIREGVEHWLDRPADLTPTARTCFLGFRAALDALIAGGPDACSAYLAGDHELAERIANVNLGKASKPAGEAAAVAVKRISNDARNLCRAIGRTDDTTIHRLLQVVAPFVDGVRESYLRQGFIGFDGLLALTRDLLRDAPQVRRALKRRFRLLLVDEFQDTDPLQYEIVLYLAERIEEQAEDAFVAQLEAGKLFVVGDAKQSVYRFRGADFAAYGRSVDRILKAGGVQLDLVGNFRSVPGVVGAVNDLFDSASGSWRPSNYQPPYVPIHAVRNATHDSPVVEIWTAELPPRVLAEDRREAEGRVVAEAISRWVEQDKRYEYEQITILFRAFTNITHYLRPLRERGIPFVVDGGRDFLRRPEVAQLMSTLRALSRPADQPSLLAYLRSPAGGVSDVELTAYAKAKGRWSWRAAPDPKRYPNIARSFEILRRLWDGADELAVDALVRRVVDRSLLMPLGAAAFEGPQRVANLQKLAASAGDLARDGTLSMEEVLEALEEGRLEDIETDRPIADDAAKAVRITSIHRMKGLENDVVIVPDLARQRGSGEYPSDAVSIATSPTGERMLALRTGAIRNSARVWFDIEDARHGDAEEVRVLYVALTRACERLVVVAAPTRKTPWLEALAPWGYTWSDAPEDGALLGQGRVRHRRCTAPARRRPSEDEVPPAATDAVHAYEVAKHALVTRARAPLAAPSGLGEERQARLTASAGSTPIGVRQSRDVGKAVGIVLHRLLERWDGKDTEALQPTMASLCDETARETRTDRGEVAAEAREILGTFLSSDLPDRFARIERIGAEVPLLVRVDDDRSFRGSVDLLYRDPDGQLVVADYKTDKSVDVDTLHEHYGAQLTVYADAVRAALDLPKRPRMELWLLRTGRVVTLDDPPPAAPSGGDPQQLSLW